MNNPFKFLDSYDKDDKDRFFGRDKETAQLYNAVHASNLVLLYGASGTGKTSLINCGLANQFHDTDWKPIFIRRGRDLNHSVRREIGKLLPEMAHDTDMPIRHLVRELYMVYYRPVYLIFDQFEELYIMGSKEEQEQFHKTISNLLQSGLQCKILIIIREEYLAYLSEFEKMVPPLYDNRLRIEKMNDKNLVRVITGTLRWGGIQLKEPKRTVSAILHNLRDKREGIDLTNLQVYLDRLFNKDVERQGGGNPDQIIFDPALVDMVGEMENVLSDFIDNEMSQIEGGLRNQGVNKPEGIPLEVLYTLVTEDGTKRNMNVSQILDNLPKNRLIQGTHIDYCLNEFERIKLLRRFAQEEE